MQLATRVSGNLDKKLAIAGAGLGLVLLILGIVQNHQFLMHASVTVFLASSVYLLLRRQKTSDISEFFRSTNSEFYLLNIAFFALLIASIIMLTRPVNYGYYFFLIIVVLMSGILAIESVCGNRKIYLPLILIELLILGVLIRAAAYYQFPSMLGGDPWYHSNFIEELIRGHRIPDIRPYDSFPVMHIVSSTISQITGLPVKDSMFMIGVLEVISVVFIYLIGRELFNEKVGLLSALMLVVTNYHIHWSYYIIAMTFGLSLVPILLFLLLILKRKRALEAIVFALLFLALGIMTHTLVSSVVSIILLLLWISFLVYRTVWNPEGLDSVPTLTIVLVHVVMMLGYWMYASGSLGLVAQVIRYGLETAGPVTMSYQAESVIMSALQRFPFYILMFFVAVGCLYAFRSSENKKAQLGLPFIFTAGGVILFILIMIVLNVRHALPWRWIVFAVIPAAIPAAVGVLYASVSRSTKRFLSILFILVIVLAGSMMTDHLSNINRSVTPWAQHPRVALTHSEVQAGETIHGYVDDPIYTDTYYLHMFKFKLHHAVEDTGSIVPGEKVGGIFLLRREALDNPLWLTGDLSELDSSTIYKSFVENEQYNLVYDCATIKGIKDRSTE